MIVVSSCDRGLPGREAKSWAHRWAHRAGARGLTSRAWVRGEASVEDDVMMIKLGAIVKITSPYPHPTSDEFWTISYREPRKRVF